MPQLSFSGNRLASFSENRPQPPQATWMRPGTDLGPDLSDPGEPDDDKMLAGKLETTGTTFGYIQDAPHELLGRFSSFFTSR